MPYSVVGGLIGGAVGTLVSPTWVSVLVSTLVGTFAGMFIGGVFPIDYKLTLMLYKAVRILDPNMPVVMEYYERTEVYGGPATNLYRDEIYYDSITYTQEYWQ